ncbi:MAG: methyl-accepting chemotaxis protein [Bacteroidales bacterium]
MNKSVLYRSVSIKSKVLILISVILLLSFTGISLSNYFTSQKAAIERITSRELPVYIDNIYNSIQLNIWKNIMVGNVMSHNNFLINWIKTSEDTLQKEEIIQFLSLLNKNYGISVNLVTDKNLHYYSNQGHSYKLKEETDSWYFNFRKSPDNMAFNINYTRTDKILKLWINNKILDESGNYMGVFGIGQDLSEVVKFILSKQFGEKGNIMMVDQNGSVKIHKNPDLIDINNQGEKEKTIYAFQGIGSVADSLLKNPDKPIVYKNEKDEKYIAIARFIPEFRWYLIVEVSKSEITKQQRESFIRNVLIGLIITLLVIMVSIILINKNLIRPIKGIISIIGNFSNGQLNFEIKTGSADEFGQILNALNQLKMSITGIAADITTVAENLVNASMEISVRSKELAGGAGLQASNIEEVSASMEEMVGNIQQNSENAKETEKIAVTSTENISYLNQSSLNSLDKVKQIANKINIINDIAFQTNLLALNAAVEAARAGESGKGFAVVASEVRKLAERSKLAADEINKLSAQSVEATEKAKTMIEEILPGIKKTSILVQNISNASTEQIYGADQVNNAIQQLNSIAQQNALTADKLNENASLFEQNAEKLMETISFFKF